MKTPSSLTLTAVSGFVAVVMGAAAAHALEGDHAKQMVEQASLYHLIHSAVLLHVIDRPGKIAGAAKVFFALGIVLFSMSIYLRYMTDIVIPAGVVPLGGVSYMLGWLALAAYGLRR